VLDDIHTSFETWCRRLQIKPVDIEEIMLPGVPLDPAI
jgi:hypothetical protein